jgi:hypothetical protein
MFDSAEDRVLINRIRSLSLGLEKEDLRREILADTTPVPIFGEYRLSPVVSIALNPSSNEFPAKKNSRRLVHLSDLDLPPDFYQRGLDSMSEVQANKILEKCAYYFENNSYKWFDTAAIALKIGFGASFYEGNQAEVRACHTDLFPWATRAFSTLDKELQQRFKRENNDFLKWFLSRDLVSSIVILGGSTWKELNKEFDFEMTHQLRPDINDAPIFHSGTLTIDSVQKRFFYSSKGPSARGSDAHKREIHEAFGAFICESK